MTLACSTYALYAESRAAKQPLPLGASKTGGRPHLPAGMAHPADRNGLLSVFHAQINLAEITHLQAWLPRCGMLYCFVNDTEYAETPNVVYADCAQDVLAACEYSGTTRWSDSDRCRNIAYRTCAAVQWRRVGPEFLQYRRSCCCASSQMATSVGS